MVGHVEEDEHGAKRILIATGGRPWMPAEVPGIDAIEPDLTLPGHSEIFVLGDMAAAKDESGKLLPEKTVIHQPVMVCREFFKETNDCYTEDPTIDHKERVPARFLGVQVDGNDEVKKKFSRFFDDSSIGFGSQTDLLKRYAADIMFNPGTSGSTHFVVLEISGRDLSHWLEKNFNEEESYLWTPSPFFVDGELLELTVAGKALSYQQSYKVLTDMESLQKRVELRKYITSDKLVSVTEDSWKGPLNTDEVNTASASYRQ